MLSPNFTALRQASRTSTSGKMPKVVRKSARLMPSAASNSDQVPVSKYSNSRLGETMPAGSQWPNSTVICQRNTNNVKAHASLGCSQQNILVGKYEAVNVTGRAAARPGGWHAQKNARTACEKEWSGR